PVVVGEGRVRKDVAEREERFHAATIEMAVSQEDALRVFDLLLSRLGVITVERRIVFPLTLERGGELARRTVFAEEDLRQCGAAFLPGVPGLDDSGDAVDPLRHIHAPARRDYDNGVLVHAADLANQFVLTRRESEGAVRTFAFAGRVEAHADDGDIGFGGDGLGFAADKLPSAGDAQTDAGGADRFKVFQPDLVPMSTFEMPSVGIERFRMTLPVIDDLLIIDKQPHSIIG